MKKWLGYILVIIGLVGLSSGVIPQIKEKIPIPASITPLYITIGSIALIIVGILLLKQGSEKSSLEVPIYKGNRIIGYRRH